MTERNPDLSKDALEVLSCLSCEPCGQCLRDLASDAFGRCDNMTRNRVRLALREIGRHWGLVREFAKSIRRPDGVQWGRPPGEHKLWSIWRNDWAATQDYVLKNWKPGAV